MKGTLGLKAVGFLCAAMLNLPLWAAQQNLEFGRFHSRAIFNQSTSNQCPAPLVILVPGSGANGPEEMIPGSMTGDGQDHSIFQEFSQGINAGNVGTLAIGKPGIEFFKSWDRNKDWFYDPTLYSSLGWQDLIDNLHDAIDFAKNLPCVDPNRISVLGHSEGTQVAVDFAQQFPNLASSLILIGFSGESLATTVDWQLFRRPIDSWMAPDVDLDIDGYISKAEASVWPELADLPWQANQDKVSFVDIEQMQRADTQLQQFYKDAASAKIWAGVFNRPPIYSEAASLQSRLFVFTGELDVQTRPEEALKLQAECAKVHKTDCEVTLVKGMGHAMSPPKGPRKQKLVDATLGPVDPTFIELLRQTALKLF